MQFLLPPPPTSIGSVLLYFQTLSRTLTTAFSSVVSSSEASPRVILRSPNGTLYTITVDDAGALQTTLTPKGGF